MKVLVCGGRDYADRAAVFGALDVWKRRRGRIVIIQGGADGADAFAREWAAMRCQPLITEFANWKVNGRRAGPERNQLMLDEWQPDIVLAFPGGKGTDDMIRRAFEDNIRIVFPVDDPSMEADLGEPPDEVKPR